MTKPDFSATPHVVNMDVVGPITVYVQGELEKFRDSVVFLTVHNTGASFNSWLEFAAGGNMEDIRRRSLFLHVALPGQEPEAEDLLTDYTFPTMEAIGLNLVTILDSLRVKRVIGLGDGAGANIMLRFAMNHPTRLHGIVLINTEGIATIQEKLERNTGNSGEDLNKKNLAKFIDAYKKRSEILSQLNAKLNIIKVEDVRDPLQEAPDKVSEALVLFCQGQGLLPTINRRASRQGLQISEGARKMSMTDYDVPNIRRLSLTARESNGAGETGQT